MLRVEDYHTNLNPRMLHSVVGGSSAALGADPVDVLGVVLDVARLAVDAVGGVNDELHVSSIVWLVLVHSSRTKPDRAQIKPNTTQDVSLTFPRAQQTLSS